MIGLYYKNEYRVSQDIYDNVEIPPAGYFGSGLSDALHLQYKSLKKEDIMANRYKYMVKNFWGAVIWGDIRTKLLGLAIVLIFFIIIGMAIAAFAFRLPFGEALWWSWTHIMDPGFMGDDKETMGRMIAGSVMSTLGLLLIGGAFITLAEEAARRTVERLMRGRLSGDLSDHTVIMGKDSGKIVEFIKALPDKPPKNKILIVVPDQQSYEEVRGKCDRLAELVMDQISDNMSSLQRFRLSCAKRLIILDDKGNDAGNTFKAINTVYNEIGKNHERKYPLEIYVEVNNHELAKILRTTINKLDRDSEMVNLHIMNVADSSARLALKKYPLDCVPILPGFDGKVMLIIEGWTPFAQALFWQALRVAHYPVKPTRILVCHHNAVQIENNVLSAAPGLRDPWCRDHLVDVTFIPFFRPNEITTDDKDIITFAICSDNPDMGFARALQYQEFPPLEGLKQIYLEVHGGSGYRDVIQSFSSSNYKDSTGDYAIKLVAVGVTDSSIDLEEKLDSLAEQIHSHYQIKYNDVPWRQLDEVKRGWNRSPADHVDIKLRMIAAMIGVKAPESEDDKWDLMLRDLIEKLASYPENGDEQLKDYIDIVSRIEHDRWAAEKYADGWTYSEGAKDNMRKKNPCLINYDSLPNHEKLKDWETMKIVLNYVYNKQVHL